MDMLNKMNKRRKDQGFTLIELMIVIAVIGILAIVLVPKVGTIKTQAKGAGIETNVRMVQGYLQSKASKWVDQKASQVKVAEDVYNAFSDVDGNEKIKNPFNQGNVISNQVSTDTSSSDNALQIMDDSDFGDAKPGSTVVIIPDGTMAGTVTFTVYGIDKSGEIATTVKVTP